METSDIIELGDALVETQDIGAPLDLDAHGLHE